MYKDRKAALFGIIALSMSMVLPSMGYPVVVPLERFKDSNATEKRIQWLAELQCISCHAPDSDVQEHLIPKGKLSLAEAGSRLSQEAIFEFISSPAKVKEGSLMPTYHGLGKDDALALSHYLASLKGETKSVAQGDEGKGRELFHTIGCIACHEPAAIKEYQPKEAVAGESVKPHQYPSVPLALAGRYSFDGLVSFLMDPLRIRHGGRMPRFELTEEEARHLATYLHRSRDHESNPKETLEPELVSQGKQVFAAQNCMACHVGPTDFKSEFANAKALAQLNENAGCLSDKPSGLDFGLSEEQRGILRDVIKRIKGGDFKKRPTAAERVDAYLTAMNCYACHQQQGKGGPDESRSVYFTVLQPAAHSLGEIGILPPKLDQTGRKLTAKWMEKLLWGEGGSVRPYMTARMPKFGKENVEKLIPSWVEASKKEPETPMDTTGLLKHHRSEYGRKLLDIGTGGLGCISCHGLKDRDSLGVPVIKLTHTVERLTPHYFKDLLLNPQAIQPGTLMPPLFAGRKWANIEIEQIWTYLKEVDQFRLPDGLVREGDYELKPEKVGKPMVFRTFLEGAGTQAIAVGFPQGVNIAFDAYEVRWSLAWKGKFLDAMSTWEERQMTPAKPLSEKLVYLTETLPFSSEKDTEMWPKKFGFEHDYHFLGYRVDKEGVPTLRYKVGPFTIEDTVRAENADRLKRTLRVSGQGSGWWYKGEETPPIEIKDGDVFEQLIQLTKGN